jgi:glycosyltransferase involved in cell wall biosynthesis
VLVVSPYSIHPAIHGGAVRIFNLIRRLADHAEISVLIFGGGTDDSEQRAALSPFCTRVLFQQVPEAAGAHDPWGLLPPAAARYASPAIRDRIAALVDAHGIDVVLLEYTEMGQFAAAAAAARTVLVEHDLSFRSYARQRSVGIHHRPEAADVLGRSRGDWLRRDYLELTACDQVDQIHVMSAADGRLLGRRLADGDRRIRVIPNGVDTRHFRTPDPGNPRHHALFVGSFPHLPNQDALDYLLREIWPLVRRRLPDARLSVAGARPPRWVLDTDGRDGVSVVGEVPDLAPLYRSHRLLAVPIRAGSGTRLKILEAMASGLPVVSTTIGAEGIEASPDRHLLVADEPISFAAAVTSLLEDSAGFGARLAAEARQLAATQYDWDRIADRLGAEIMGLAADRCVGRSPAVTEPAAQSLLASVIIVVAEGGSNLNRCLSAVANQPLEGGAEIICVGSRLSAPDRDLAERHGAVVVETGIAGQPRGSALNAAARAARGRVLVLLAEDAIPADERWLNRLVAPFRSDAAPAAVQGGLHVQFVAGGPPYDPRFTAETRRWRESFGGLAFSTTNAAIRRDVWERFPPPPSPGLVDLRWQRELASNGELILPCWAAAVQLVRPLKPAAVARTAWREGRSWRDLGDRYRLTELVTDLWRGAAPPDSPAGESAAASEITRSHRLYAVLRSVVLYLGNCLPAAAQRAGYNPAGETLPHATDGLFAPESTE